jgi:hypothetical protein
MKKIKKKIGRNFILKEAIETGTSRTRVVPCKKKGRKKGKRLQQKAAAIRDSQN